MQPYSRDLRLRVVHAYENREGSMRQLATRFQVSLSFVRDLMTRYRATGDVHPKPHGGGAPAKLDDDGLAAVRTLVQAHPDGTLQELCEQLAATQRIRLSQATMSRALTKLGLPRKKKRFGPLSKIDRMFNANGPRSWTRCTLWPLKTWSFWMKRVVIMR